MIVYCKVTKNDDLCSLLTNYFSYPTVFGCVQCYFAAARNVNNHFINKFDVSIIRFYIISCVIVKMDILVYLGALQMDASGLVVSNSNLVDNMNLYNICISSFVHYIWFYDHDKWSHCGCSLLHCQCYRHLHCGCCQNKL